MYTTNTIQTYKPIKPEPKRDWAWGILTGHRLMVVSLLILGIALLYFIQSLIWFNAAKPDTTFERIWELGGLLWISTIIPGTLGLLGLLRYKHANHLDSVKPIHTLVSFRIVSRGINKQALLRTIRRCQKEMKKTPLFPYIIEVVTDTKVIHVPSPNKDIRYLAIPHKYKTTHHSLYKARALHYAVEKSTIPDDAWIVHLDEETQPTSSGIKGICHMINEEESTGKYRIGQGAILYHRKWKKFPYLTLADNIRTGDDFAQFYFQHKLGITLFGFHGSYIVVRNSIEKSIGFDVGPKGSITEDAFWALIAMQKGYRTRWVDGYLEEQSTQSIMDFIRQRRRWFQGLVKVSLHAPVKFHWRFPIGINTILWAIAPFAQLYTFLHFFYGFESEWWIRLLANYSFVIFNLMYIVGLHANIKEYRKKTKLKHMMWFPLQILLFPTFNLLESLGVMAAVFRPVAGFHVVKK